MTLIANIRKPDFEKIFGEFLFLKRETIANVDAIVEAVIEQVRLNGDAALVELTKKHDRHDIDTNTLRFTEAEKARSIRCCTKKHLSALSVATERIRDYHKRQLPEDLDYVDATGVRLGYRWKPICAIGLYVPGGTASYPSSVLMNALPAKAAGVQRIVMVVPTPDGEINPLVLAAADIAGVDEMYRVGGAQAIAALAYGTESIEAVDKIVGPGNIYVSAAKKMVFGQVGIDMIAGPSEILVIADGSNDPDWIAADLLSQAEHDTCAQAILITDSKKLAEQVRISINQHLNNLSRAAIAEESWRTFGAIFVVEQLDQAIPLVDKISPEHLLLAVQEPDALANNIKNAGAIFLGRYTPEALGDYVAGPSHVLPTDRSARFSSGLGVLDFMKRTSLIGGDAKSFRAIAPAALALAEAEGLDAHALSLSIRLDADNGG
jgi:histidinol dehydrogenase